jgi:hypothetical protein
MPFDAAPVRSPLPNNIAAQSALMLDMVEFYFDGGKRWGQNAWARGERRCLLGAVKFVRSQILCDRDQAEYYLARAIAPARPNASAASNKIHELLYSSIVMRFNDTNDRTYSEIADALCKAKELAEADARTLAGSCPCPQPRH